MDIDLIIDGLNELSDINEQERLWLSDGMGGKEVSSFDEASERIFSDSRFTFECSTGAIQMEKMVISKLWSLGQLLTKSSGNDVCSIKFIHSQEMNEIRIAAKECLEIISAQ